MYAYGNTGEETGFGDAEEETGDEEAVVALHDAHQGHDGAPGDHDEGQPPAGAQFLEEKVAGNLEGGVGEEEDGEAPIVLVRAHAEVLLQTLDLCVADVAP